MEAVTRELFPAVVAKSTYLERVSQFDAADKIGIDTPALSTTTTLYVGGLSNETREEQIYLFFGTMGPVRRVIMGLDRVQKVPCGFCFVEYRARDDAERAVTVLKGLKLDDRPLQIDWDTGYKRDREWGRVKTGRMPFRRGGGGDRWHGGEKRGRDDGDDDQQRFKRRAMNDHRD